MVIPPIRWEVIAALAPAVLSALWASGLGQRAIRAGERSAAWADRRWSQ